MVRPLLARVAFRGGTADAVDQERVSSKAGWASDIAAEWVGPSRGTRTEAGTMALPGSAGDGWAGTAGTFGWDPSSAADRWLLRPESGRLLEPALSGCAPVQDAGAAVPSGMRSAAASRTARRSADAWACAAGPDSCPAVAAVAVAVAAASPDRASAGCVG